MIHQNKNLIYMNRGDSGSISVSITNGNEYDPQPIELTEDHKIYFGVMEPQVSFEYGIIRKVFTKDDVVNNVLTINLKPTDTEFLNPGTYYWSVKLAKEVADEGIFDRDKHVGEVDTIIPRNKFIILE